MKGIVSLQTQEQDRIILLSMLYGVISDSHDPSACQVESTFLHLNRANILHN